jgi:hypothetical protein
MYGVDYVDADLVVYDASQWVYSGTGLRNGDHLYGLVGYEIDSLSAYSPPGITLLAHSPVGGGPYADTSVYTAGSGATVFAAGTFQWSWGLDDYNAPTLHSSRVSAAAQQMTRNILARFIGALSPPPLSPYTLTASPSTVLPGASITVNWTAPSGHSTTDWIGLYAKGAPDTNYISYQYVSSSTSGTLTFIAPSTAGTYEFRYFLNNVYNKVATSNSVTVTTSTPTPTPTPTPVQCSISVSPSSLTIPRNGSGTVSVSLSNLSGKDTITATSSNSGQIQVSPASATVTGSSSATFTIVVKRNNGSVTFSSSCGSQTVSVTVN